MMDILKLEDRIITFDEGGEKSVLKLSGESYEDYIKRQRHLHAERESCLTDEERIDIARIMKKLTK